MLYPALCLGARGGHPGRRLLRARTPRRRSTARSQAGDHARARRLQVALTPLATAVTATYGVPGLKLAMDVAGFRGGDPRPPLLPAPASARPELERLLADLRSALSS